MVLIFVLICWTIIYGAALRIGGNNPDTQVIGVIGIFVWHLGTTVLTKLDTGGTNDAHA